ncbi:MAG: efflux RND transporter periplasmic adaptor subunit, partial [Candidatus Coatesbacteria bacterium]|nr:efflux RND transporter periplasmic adaptor subunit [Candidatus Coatesbacteria bacterium]
AAVHVAEASVNVARDALEVADYNLAQSTVKTFIAGQVAKRSINVGELAYPASPLPYYYIVDDSICKVEANLPDTIQSLVMESQEVKMTVDGIPGRTFSGNITYVAETIDPISRTLTIRAQVANPDGVLKCGALARLKILSDRKEDVVTAPIRCVVKRNGSPIVFIVNSGTASARKVHLGLAGEDEVEIAEGLEPSDVVVVEGTESLEDGMSVEVINSAQLNP